MAVLLLTLFDSLADDPSSTIRDGRLIPPYMDQNPSQDSSQDLVEEPHGFE